MNEPVFLDFYTSVGRPNPTGRGQSGCREATLIPHQNRENDVGQARKRPE